MEGTSNFKKYWKVIIFGDDQVGKTSIVKKLCGNQMDFNYQKTKGIKSSKIKIQNNEEEYFVNFFEVNTNENLSAFLETLLFDTCLIIFVYDLANELSFTRMMTLINKIENLEISEKIFQIIIGNKSDLREDRSFSSDLKFEKSEIQKYERSDNHEIIEMSTLTNDNLHVLKRLMIGVFQENLNELDSILFEETDGFTKPSAKADRTLNIMLLGEPRVGKTSFFENFFDNDKKDDNYMVTVGVDKKSKLIKIGNIFYNLQIWDTAGQEVYHSITKTYYKKSDGLIIIYDVTDESSFAKVEKWLKEIEQNANRETVVYLVGNKIDCVDHRVVEKEKAENTSKMINKRYFEISAKFGINLKETVHSIVKDILKLKNFTKLNNINIIVPDREKVRNNAGSSCCGGSN